MSVVIEIPEVTTAASHPKTAAAVVEVLLRERAALLEAKAAKGGSRAPIVRKIRKEGDDDAELLVAANKQGSKVGEMMTSDDAAQAGEDGLGGRIQGQLLHCAASSYCVIH